MPVEWTTDEQKAFLKAELVMFKRIGGCCYTKHWTMLYNKWFQIWSERSIVLPNLPEDAALTGKQKDNLTQAVLRHQHQLRRWMHWHSGAGQNCSVNNKTVRIISELLKPKTRAKKPWKVYSKMFFRTCIQPEITGTRMSITNINKKIQEMFKNESLDCRKSKSKEVEGEESNDSDLEAGDSDVPQKDPVTLCSNIEQCGTALQRVLEHLGNQTGWKFTVLMGGPDPMDSEGENIITSLHTGKTKDSQDFANVYSGFDTDMVEAYSEFLAKVFCGDDNKEGKDEHKDKKDDGNDNGNNDDDDDDDAEGSDADEGESQDNGGDGDGEDSDNSKATERVHTYSEASMQNLATFSASSPSHPAIPPPAPSNHATPPTLSNAILPSILSSPLHLAIPPGLSNNTLLPMPSPVPSNPATSTAPSRSNLATSTLADLANFDCSASSLASNNAPNSASDIIPSSDISSMSYGLNLSGSGSLEAPALPAGPGSFTALLDGANFSFPDFTFTGNSQNDSSLLTSSTSGLSMANLSAASTVSLSWPDFNYPQFGAYGSMNYGPNEYIQNLYDLGGIPGSSALGFPNFSNPAAVSAPLGIANAPSPAAASQLPSLPAHLALVVSQPNSSQPLVDMAIQSAPVLPLIQPDVMDLQGTQTAVAGIPDDIAAPLLGRSKQKPRPSQQALRDNLIGEENHAPLPSNEKMKGHEKNWRKQTISDINVPAKRAAKKGK